MNINIFFFIISIGLMMIFFLFKPMLIKQQEFIDVPLFELSSFSLYELNSKGLNNLMIGKQATKYNDRYTVENVDYTDNSDNFLANMKADKGIYKDDVVELKGDVTYTREDGLVFTSQSVIYNKKTAIASTDRSYVSYRGKDKVTGSSLRYDNLLNQVSSKNVVAIYNFQEKTE